MDAETLLLETEEAMLKAVDFARQEFSGVRTGKASPGLVETWTCTYPATAPL